jgi:7,8-didemethyl-8-hydroxy-5-deazariboflavin synthase
MRTVTYSHSIFLPVIDLCRNRCGYCSFWREAGSAHLISQGEAIRLLAQAKYAGCHEALLSLGESPWDAPGFEMLMPGSSRSNFIDYLVELCEMALKMGLLPHTNAGILCEEDLQRLSPYNASMGLMLETVAEIPAHSRSPGKRPELRMEYIALAGRMKIPFTTGILLGIGESREDRIKSLESISDLHKTYDHIQEVIIQPLDPKSGTDLGFASPPSMDDICETVSMAREMLPSDVSIQVAPNLVDPRLALKSGANDLGGISPITPDWINPDKPWPRMEDLRGSLSDYDLRERLAVYPRYVLRGWAGGRTKELLSDLADKDGLCRSQEISSRELRY